MISIKNFFKPPKPESRLSSVLRDIKDKNTEKYRNVYSSDMCIVKIQSYCKNIIEYINLLELITSKLCKDETITTYSLPTEIDVFYIRDFFTDDKFNFIDPVSNLTEFLDLTYLLIEEYDKRMAIIEKTFDTERNLRMLNNIIANLVTIVNQL